MPKVLAHVDGATFAVHGAVQQRLHLLFELFVPLAAEDMVRNGPHLQQEGDVTQEVVRIAVDGEPPSPSTSRPAGPVRP